MLNISCCESDWSNHYVDGIQSYQNKEFGKAKLAFTQAIELTKKEKDESHIFIRTNRAKTFLALEEYYKALEDINEVIDCPSLSNKDLIDALEIRMRVYAGLEMHHRFQEDYIWYKSLNPYMPIFEYTNKYIIVRNCEMMKEDDQEFTYGLFVATGLCVDCSKIIRFNDTIVIERKNISTCSCSSECCEKESDILKDKERMENCHKNCDLVAHIASEISGTLIVINPNLFGMMTTIEVIRNGCRKCCGDNGGFYMNCIQPITDYLQMIKNRLKAMLDFQKRKDSEKK
jgi:tetratricopeptide (TPR) repeat protein